jgi:hypothetical protein
LALAFLILRILGADPVQFALRSRYPFLYLVFLIFVVLVGVLVVIKKTGRKLADAYETEPKLVKRHVEAARREIEAFDPEAARVLGDSWSAMGAEQRELFTKTYLEDRYRSRLPPGLSTPDQETLAKAYWYRIKTEESE